MSFSDATLLKKIQELNNTQQSVQTLSLWLIHHRKHSKTIVETWLQSLVSAEQCDRKINFIYLANDILQNSRKKGNEFLKEFLVALPDAIEDTSKMADSKTRFTLERIFNIWKDRKIYPDETIKKLKTVLHAQPKIDESTSPHDKGVTKSAAKSKITITKSQSEPVRQKVDGRKVEGASKLDEEVAKKRKASNDEKMNEVPLKLWKKSLREEILKELSNTELAVQAPEPLELVAKLQELEKSASSDAVIREKIAELPPKVIDANAVKNLRDKKLARELLEPVVDAGKLVDDYNSRLQQELSSRKQTALLMGAYVKQLKEANEQDQKTIEEWQLKLKQVKSVENELQVHLKSLPDLASIEEAAIMRPLPSAGDLFSN